MDRQRLDAAVELACSAKAIMEDEGLLSSSHQKGEFDFVTRIDLSVEQPARSTRSARCGSSTPWTAPPTSSTATRRAPFPWG